MNADVNIWWIYNLFANTVILEQLMICALFRVKGRVTFSSLNVQLCLSFCKKKNKHTLNQLIAACLMEPTIYMWPTDEYHPVASQPQPFLMLIIFAHQGRQIWCFCTDWHELRVLLVNNSSFNGNINLLNRQKCLMSSTIKLWEL